MSQIPNTTGFESALPGARIARGGGSAIQIPGQQESLVAPGLDIIPPVIGGPDLAGELMTALGLAGQAGQAIESTVRQSRAEEERAAREAEARQAHADRLQEGQGSLDGETDLPGIQAQIASGQIERIGGLSAADQARTIVQGLTAGLPEAAARGYGRRVQEHIARSLAGEDFKVIDDARRASLRAASGNAIAAETPEARAAAFADSAIPGASEADRMSATYLAAAKFWAFSGDSAKAQEQFAFTAAEIRSRAGNAYDTEIANFGAHLTDRLGQEDRQREQAAAQVYDRRLYDAENGNDTFAGVRAAIDADTTLRPNQRLSLLDSVNAREQRQLTAIQKFVLTAEEDRIKGQYLDTALKMAIDGDLPLVRGLKAERSDGKEITIGEKEARDMVAGEVYRRNRLDKTYADPEQQRLAVFERDVKWSAANGYTNTAWQSQLTAGVVAADPGILESGTTPPAAMDGLRLYKEMKRVAPSYLNSILQPSDVNFYEAASALEEMEAVGSVSATSSPAEAEARTRRVLLGARQVADGAPFAALTPDQNVAIMEAATTLIDDQSWWSGSNDNPGMVAAEIRRFYSIYTRLGRSGDAALAAATKQVTANSVLIGDYSVYLGGIPMHAEVRENIGVLARTAIESYTKAGGFAPGGDATTLTMVPDRKTGVWQITDALTGIPLEDAISASAMNRDNPEGRIKTTYTSTDLFEMLKERRKIEFKEAEARSFRNILGKSLEAISQGSSEP